MNEAETCRTLVRPKLEAAGWEANGERHYREQIGITAGVSVDDVASHKVFAEEHKLPFDILADSDKQVLKLYGVLFSAGPMQLASRQTFLIDPTGKIVKHWPKVDPKGHSEMVLAEIKAHSPATSG